MKAVVRTQHDVYLHRLSRLLINSNLVENLVSEDKEHVVHKNAVWSLE